MNLQKNQASPLLIKVPKFPKSNGQNKGSEKMNYPNVLISTKNGMECLMEQDILYAKAQGSYTTIYLTNGRQYTSSKKLKEVENIINSNSFFRIHHSHLINLHHLKIIRNHTTNLVLLSDGTELEISKRKKRDFLAVFKRM